jgi:hypothetical protein
MREIKHCPFCEYDSPRLLTYLSSPLVACERCGTRGPIRDTEDAAIAAWNVRAEVRT